MIRRTVFLGAVVAALALIAPLAVAQGFGGGGGGFRGGQGGGFRGGMGGPRLLLNPSVQQELKLSPEQVQKIQALFGQQGGAPPGGGPPGGGGQRMTPEEREKMRAEQEKQIKQILDANQYERYQQISLQQEGPAAFARKEVADALGLSEAQRNQVRSILDAQRQAQQEMFQGGGGGGDRQAMMEAMQKLREETNKKLLAVLTKEQSDKWTAMLGKPFQIQRQPPPAK